MFTIAKRFSFCAAHRLVGLEKGHKCGRLHGHTYEVELIIAADALDERGFAGVDYAELRPFREWLDESWDHRTLLQLGDPIGDVLAKFEGGGLVTFDFNPTAENLARELYAVAKDFGIPGVVAVRVSETPNTWAEYRPE